MTFAGKGAAEFTTWDGKSVAESPPYGAMVVVWRSGPEILLLHRAQDGPGLEGDWALTPPLGARLPGEEPAACARREVREKTGLELYPVPVDVASDWAVFVAEVDQFAEVTLDVEHDRCEWVSIEEALARCASAVVTDGIRRAGEHLRTRG